MATAVRLAPLDPPSEASAAWITHADPNPGPGPDHLASGAVVPVIDRTVDLEHVPDAIRDLAAGRIAGKAAAVIRSA